MKLAAKHEEILGQLTRYALTGGLASLIGISEATLIAALTVGVAGVATFTLVPSIRDYAREPAQDSSAWGGPAATPVVAREPT